MMLFYILLFTALGSVASLIGGVILLFRQALALKISHVLFSFAAGTLLGTAFFDLLPEASEEARSALRPFGLAQGGQAQGSGQAGETDIFLWTLVGMLVFFLLERFIRWFHHHHAHKDETVEPTVPLIVFGDSIHNFIDGVAIAATFLASIPLGIATSLAVAAHEIPQEVGDFAILLRKGVPRRKVLFFNILSSLTAILGALLTFFAGEFVKGMLPVFLSVTAGFFIYIAASDLIPEIHEEKRRGFAFMESLLLLLGVFIVWLFAMVTQG